MKWLMLLYQEGGCDYTIGCGRRWELFDAPTKEEALSYARENHNKYGDVNEVTVLQIVEENGKPVIFKANLEAWEREAANNEKRLEQEEEERKDREEYKRLRKKFDDKSG